MHVHAGGVQVSLLLEGIILGQPRQAERRHLDPMRHMEPDVASPTPSLSTGGELREAKERRRSETGKAAVKGGGVQMQSQATPSFP